MITDKTCKRCLDNGSRMTADSGNCLTKLVLIMEGYAANERNRKILTTIGCYMDT